MPSAHTPTLGALVAVLVQEDTATNPLLLVGPLDFVELGLDFGVGRFLDTQNLRGPLLPSLDGALGDRQEAFRLKLPVDELRYDFLIAIEYLREPVFHIANGRRPKGPVELLPAFH